MPHATQHPGNEIFARPDEVDRASLTPGSHGERVGLHGLQVVGHVERPQHHACHLVVTERIHVQAVVVEEPHVLHLFERPLVGDDAVVAVGDAADVLVVDRDLATEVAEDRGEVRVDAGEHDDRGTAAHEAHDGVLELLRDGIRVAAGPDDVVAPGGEGDEIGLEGEARRRPAPRRPAR